MAKAEDATKKMMSWKSTGNQPKTMLLKTINQRTINNVM